MSQAELHPSIIALISLASGIAGKHPSMGLCQLERLRSQGIPENQIQTAIEIARHIRDEAAEKLDATFDEKAAGISEPVEAKDGEACCTPTASGQACC